MKPSPFTQAARWWLAGIALAALGIVGVRVISPQFIDPVRAVISVAGQLFALIGLGVIALGVHRRVHRVADPDLPAKD